MFLDYKKIFKQAWQITKANKLLWIFGLFLSFFDFTSVWPNDSSKIELPGYVFFIALGLILALVILYFRIRASLIIATKAIIDKQETSAKKVFKVSNLFFGRMFSISVRVGLGLAILALIIGFPVFYMFDHGFTYRGTILGILGLMIYAPIFIIGMLISTLGPLYVVIFDQKSEEAIAKSFQLVSQHWQSLTVMFLMLGIMELPLFFINFMVGLRRGLMEGILGAVAFLALQMLFSVFSQTTWILAFSDLVKPQKLEETEPVIVPETAGG